MLVPRRKSYTASSRRTDLDHRSRRLLTGLALTLNFSNASTNPKAVEAAAKLVGAGGRFQDILKHGWNSQTVDAQKLWGLMLSRLQHHPDYDLAATYILQKDTPDPSAKLGSGSSNDVVDGIANFLSAVTGSVDTILVLKEIPDNQVKGSFRSLSRDVSKVARLLGGGGHKKAAGFTVKGRIEVTEKGPVVVS